MGPEIADLSKPEDRVIEFIDTTGVVSDDAFDPNKTVLEVKNEKRDKGKEEASGNFDS